MTVTELKVSVIMPAYNAGGYVAQAISSVLSQDQSAVEVLVVDDGSYDGTRGEIERVADGDPRVRYFYQENQGSAAARNHAIRHARGQYLRCLDADDYMVSDSLAKQVRLMESHPHADMSFGQSYTVSHEAVSGLQRPLLTRNVVELDSRTAFRWLLKGGSALRMSTMMARAEAVRRAGLYKTEAQSSEDWNMYMSIAAAGSLVYLPEPLAYRREHPASQMANLTRDQYLRSHLYTLNSLFGKPGFAYADLKGEAYAVTYLVAARLAAQAGERTEFVDFFFRAAKESPASLMRPEMLQALYHGAKSLLPDSIREAFGHPRVKREGATSRG